MKTIWDRAEWIAKDILIEGYRYAGGTLSDTELINQEDFQEKMTRFGNTLRGLNNERKKETPSKSD